MNRIHKISLALVAAMALTALMASAAIAAKGFTSSVATTTTLSGTQVGNHEFTTGSGFGAIKCTTANFVGMASGTFQETLAIEPTYAGCKDSLGRTVHIIDNTLEYTFSVTGTNAEGTPIGDLTQHGSITLTITSSTHCTVTVSGTQTFKGAVVYHNSGGTNGITITTNITTKHSTLHGNFFGCGVSGTYPITSTNGTYKGTTTFTGKGPIGEAASISADAH